jgi:hypothetical protein
MMMSIEPTTSPYFNPLITIGFVLAMRNHS